MKKTILFGMITAMGLASCSEEDGLMQGMSGNAIVFTSSVASRVTDTSFEPNAIVSKIILR